MNHMFSLNIPLYIQLIDVLKRKIVSGEWEPGVRIPSVRDLAQAYSVTPNTIQRALMELERDDILFTKRTSGKFVTDAPERLSTLRKQIMTEIVDRTITTLLEYGFAPEEIITSVERSCHER